MNNVNDWIVQANKAAFEHYQAVALASLEGIGRIANLNVSASKSSFEESLAQIRALMSVKDSKAFADMTSGMSQPDPAKAGAYAKQMAEIATQTSTEIADLFQKRFAETNRKIQESIETLAASAPAGSEPFVAFFRQSLAVANTAFEQANKAARQAADLAQANMGAAARTAQSKKK